jgi:hypothetical protein
VIQGILCYKRASGPWFREHKAVLARLFRFWVLRIVVFSRVSNIGYAGIRAKAKEYSGFEGAKD